MADEPHTDAVVLGVPSDIEILDESDTVIVES